MKTEYIVNHKEIGNLSHKKPIELFICNTCHRIQTYKITNSNTQGGDSCEHGGGAGWRRLA